MGPLTLPMKGSCICQTIQFTLTAQPIFTNCCHCRTCQSLSGSAFAVNLMIERANITITSPTQPVIKLPPSPDGETDNENPKWKSFFCGICWSMLWGTHMHFGDEIVFLRAGHLEGNEQVTPDAHFFVRSKHPWVRLPEGARAFETMPGEGDEPLWTEEVMGRVQAGKG